MPDDQIAADVRRFIAEHINSVEQLEILLLLQRDPAHEWLATDVSRELASHPHSVETRLLDLRARGLVDAREVGRSAFAYRRSAAHAAEVAALANAYAQRRTSVITLIFSKPIDTVRTLADAFRFRDPPRKVSEPERPEDDA